ncbi:MAG: enamine deaminase RidA [Acidiferrobacteraceae bacterium]|nr:enamine deaminase RidA [Acidiferrobacteraceae bacterium]|tara:strand:- start:409 stop:801 length:393 start_codon:yes stop_codon:yes gene_type:complete
MNWHPISVPKLGPPIEPYEYAIQSGRTIYLAGQVALDNEGKIVGTTTEEQSRKAWENISTVLAAAGASVQDIVKVTYYLEDIRELKEEMKVRKEIFAGRAFPAVTAIQAAALGMPGLRLEIDVIAEIENA